MQLPSLLPMDLKDVALAANDRELFEKLIPDTDRLVNFFSYAADDETWASLHEDFIRMALNSLTSQYAQNRLQNSYAEVIVRALHEHYNILKELLPRPVALRAQGKEFKANPLILGFMSPYFKEFLQAEKQDLNLGSLNSELAAFALHYLEEGEAEDLWKFHAEEVQSLLDIAEKWRVAGLKIQCEDVLCRYINIDNMEESLHTSFKGERWKLLERGIERFNQKFSRTILSSPKTGTLSLEFLDFGEAALAAFNSIKDILTHIKVSGKLASDEEFIKVISSSPKLMALSLKHTEEWSSLLLKVPPYVREWDLSECAWLGDQELRLLTVVLAQVHTLGLAQNTQLSYRGFAELKKVPLKVIDLSRCYQLENESLNLILQGAPGLFELNLHSCRKLTDQAFYEIARRANGLRALKVSRTLITDGGLMDIGTRCHSLRVLEADHCLNLSEAGIDDFLKKAKELRVISLKENRLDPGMRDVWKVQYPSLDIQWEIINC